MDKNRYTTIYIIRHAQSEANEKGILQGQLDFPLTELGEKQVAYYINEFKNIKLDEIFSSDLARAKKTAEIIALNQHLDVQTATALRERNYGILQGKKNIRNDKELKNKFEEWNSLDSKLWLSYRIVDDSETGDEMMQRFLNFLRNSVFKKVGQTVLIVTHGGIMKNLLIYLKWLTPIELKQSIITNNSYIKLKTDHIDLFIEETKGINKK